MRAMLTRDSMLSEEVDILAATDMLVDARDLIEGVFLKVGDQLIATISLIQEVETAFADAARACSDQELGEAETAILRLVDCIRALPEAMRIEHAQMQAVIASVNELVSPLHEMDWIARTIGAVAVYARIASASIGDDSDLSVFTEEVSNYAQSACNIVKSVSESRCRLHDLLVEAERRSAAFGASFSQAADETLAELQALTDAARIWRHQQSSGALEAVAQCQQQVSSIAQIVNSLQIGDATRQKIEHVIEAIALAETEPHAADLVIALQSAQLEDSAREMAPALQEISQGLRALGSSARALVQTGGGQTFTAPGDFSIERMHVAVQMAARVLDHAHEMRRSLDETARTTIDTAELLASHVSSLKDLEHGMRMVSLNTAIACSRLGEKGLALSAISQQLRELVGTMVSCSDNAAVPMSAIGALATAMSVSKTQTDADQFARLSDDAAGNALLIERVNADLQAADGMVKGVAARVEDVSAETLLHLEGQKAIFDRIETAGGFLRSSVFTQSPDADQAGVLNRLRARYTMHRERQVHDWFTMSLTGTEAPVEAGSGDNDAELCAILF